MAVIIGQGWRGRGRVSVCDAFLPNQEVKQSDKSTVAHVLVCDAPRRLRGNGGQFLDGHLPVRILVCDAPLSLAFAPHALTLPSGVFRMRLAVLPPVLGVRFGPATLLGTPAVIVDRILLAPDDAVLAVAAPLAASA
jgi:hypothetical protein